MALWICKKCGAAYSVGARCCPQCTSTEYEEADVAKISVNDGPSDKRDPQYQPEAETTADSAAVQAAAAPAPEQPVQVAAPAVPAAVPPAPVPPAVNATGGLQVPKPGAGDGA